MNTSFFTCPVCGNALNGDKTFKCENNHSFDKNKHGYLLNKFFTHSTFVVFLVLFGVVVVVGLLWLFLCVGLGLCFWLDSIIVIENGKVKECGSHMQLMELDGLYAEMFRSQARWYTEEGSIGYEEK